MLRIERYLAAELFRPVAGVLLGLSIVVVVFYASRIMAEAAADRFPMAVVGQLLLIRLGLFLDVLVPVALLLGVVLGIGRLQSAHELTAMAALGAGGRRILFALVVPALALALLVAALSLLYRPWAYATLYQIEAGIATEVSLAQVEPGRFTPLSRNLLLFAREREGETLYDVLLQQRQQGGIGLLRAERLEQERDEAGRHQLVFSGNVSLYRFGADGEADLLGRFDRLQLLFSAPLPPARERLRRALPLTALLGSDDPMYGAELQWRLLAPVSVLVLALVGLTLGRVDPRRGQSSRVLGATLLATLYFSVLGVLMNWFEQDRIPPWPGIFWLPLAALCLLALRYRLVHRRPGGPP